MHRGKSVSLVIPAHDEEAGLPAVLARVPTLVDEVVVVDNLSTDGTAAVARRHGATVVPCGLKGYGHAYAAGLAAASGELLVTCDADATYPIGDAARLVDHLLDANLDFLSGSRFPLRRADSMAWRVRAGNAGMTALANALFGCGLRDVLSGMWVMRAESFRQMTLVSGNWNFSEEIKLEAWSHPAIRFGEVPIDYAPRLGQSKVFHPTVAFENAAFLFRKRVDCWRRFGLRAPALEEP